MSEIQHSPFSMSDQSEHTTSQSQTSKSQTESRNLFYHDPGSRLRFWPIFAVVVLVNLIIVAFTLFVPYEEGAKWSSAWILFLWWFSPIAFLVASLFFFRVFKLDLVRAIIPTRFSLRVLAACFLLFFGWILFAQLVHGGLFLLFDLSKSYWSMFHHGDLSAARLIQWVLLKPVALALLFYGLMFQALRQNVGIKTALVVVTLMVFPYYNAVDTLIFVFNGLILCLIVLATRALIYPILVQVAYFALIFLTQIGRFMETIHPSLVIAVGAAMMAIGIALLLRESQSAAPE